MRLREQLGYGEYAAFWDGKEWWGTDMPIGRDRTPTWLWLDEAISHWAFGVPGHRDLIIGLSDYRWAREKSTAH